MQAELFYSLTLLLHVNFQALNEEPVFQQMRKPVAEDGQSLIPDETQRRFGVSMSDLASMTWLVSRHGQLQVIRARKPYDQQAVMKSITTTSRARFQKHRHKGKTLYVLSWNVKEKIDRFGRDKGDQAPAPPPRPGRWSQTLYFASPRTFVFGSFQGITALVEKEGKGDLKGLLSDALKHVISTKHHVGIGAEVPAKLRDTMDRMLRQEVRRNPLEAAVLHNVLPLLRIKSASAIVNVGSETKVTVRAQYQNQAEAREAKTSAQFALSLARGILGYGQTEMEKGGFRLPHSSKTAELWTRIDNALADSVLEQKDHELIVRAQAKTELKLIKASLQEALPQIRFARNRSISQNNLKQIGLALHGFHDLHRALPLPTWQNHPTKPVQKGAGLSWRVALLPYLEQGELYKRFKLDEPWDSEHNKKLIKEMPQTFAAPGVLTRQPGLTYYRVFTGAGTLFNPVKTVRFSQIPDGISNTLMVVEAGEPVIWTKPDDLPYDPKKPLPKLGGLFRQGFNVLFGDGSITWLSRTDKGVPKDFLRAVITSNGGEVVRIPRADDEGHIEREREKALPRIDNGTKRPSKTKPEKGARSPQSSSTSGNPRPDRP